MPNETYTYKGYYVRKLYRQWYSDLFGYSFTTRRDFIDHIDGLIARDKIQAR